jgi:hypothetical protein
MPQQDQLCCHPNESIKKRRWVREEDRFPPRANPDILTLSDEVAAHNHIDSSLSRADIHCQRDISV